MRITELENDSESVWVKAFANKTSHFVASWYRPPFGDLEKLESQLASFESQLEKIKDIRGVIKKFAEKCYKIVLLVSIAMKIHKFKLLLFAS